MQARDTRRGRRRAGRPQVVASAVGERRLLVEQLGARSRSRRGSTSTTRSLGPSRSVKRCSSADEPREERLHAVERARRRRSARTGRAAKARLGRERCGARSRTSSVERRARGSRRSRPRSRSRTERWSATSNSVSRSTSSPKQSMRTPRVRRRGEDVDDAAAHGELAAVLDLVLAAVAARDEARDELVEVDAARRGATTTGSASLDPRAEALQQRLHRRDDDHRPAPARSDRRRRRGAGATAPAGAGPSSRSPARPARRAASPTPAGARRASASTNGARSCASCSASAAVGVATSSDRRAPRAGERGEHERRAPPRGPRRRRRRRRAARRRRPRRRAAREAAPGRQPLIERCVHVWFIGARSGPSTRTILDRVGGHLDRHVEQLAVGSRRRAQHVVGAGAAAGRLADADADRTNSRLCRCDSIDRSPLWPAVPPPSLTCTTPGGEVELVVHDDEPVEVARPSSAARAAARRGRTRSCRSAGPRARAACRRSRTSADVGLRCRARPRSLDRVARGRRAATASAPTLWRVPANSAPGLPSPTASRSASPAPVAPGRRARGAGGASALGAALPALSPRRQRPAARLRRPLRSARPRPRPRPRPRTARLRRRRSRRLGIDVGRHTLRQREVAIRGSRRRSRGRRCRSRSTAGISPGLAWTCRLSISWSTVPSAWCTASRLADEIDRARRP